MSGDEKPPNASQNSLPLSQDTFSFLWDHLSNTTSNGSLTQALQSPINWNFNDYNGGDTVEENHIELHMDRCELTPNDMQTSDNDDILSTTNSTISTMSFQNQQSTFNNVLSPDSAMPSSVPSDYSADVTPPPPAFTPPPSSGAASQSLPSNVNYPGDYEFMIYLGQPTPTAAKSVSWTYSNALKKLFVDKDKPCPIQFKTTKAPPAGSYIRAMPIFKKPEHIQQVVKRCPNHASCVQNDLTAYHLVMSSDPSSQYVEDPNTGRLSVIVPYNVPQVGTEYSQYLYTFKCFLSCVGGLNRRQIQVVFTLETNGQILGRQVIDVRVCACPGRDRKGEEKCQNEKQSKKPSKRASKVTSSFEVTTIGGKKRKTEDEQIYTIFVKGKEKYDLLMKIKESLDLMEYLTPTQIQAYKSNQKMEPPQLVEFPRLTSIPTQPVINPADLQMPNHHAYVNYNQHHPQQQVHLQGMVNNPEQQQQPMPPHSAPPLNHIPSMPSFPTFQFSQHPSHSGADTGAAAGHDIFLQSMARDMADSGSTTTPMEINNVQATSSQGFNIISSEEISSSHQLQNQNISPTRSPPNQTSPHHQHEMGSPHHHEIQQQQQHTTQQVRIQHAVRSTHHMIEVLQEFHPHSASMPLLKAAQLVCKHASKGSPTGLQACSKGSPTGLWLARLGVGQYTDAFQRKGIGNTDQLDEIQLEDFNDMQIPSEARQRIWKAILELRNPSSQLNSTPSLLKNSSNASTLSVRSQCSYSGQPAPLYHATRFTLKQTLSFKVKHETEEQPGGSNGPLQGGSEMNGCLPGME
ncbi:tumor protein 63-like [Amphiura filiformis]|uniref:tumor protein 63-like n=1 Tax=Amphiura filiformis TaxID=82378 RepID=UPI003B210D7E